MEDCFGEKLKAVTSEIHHLGDRVCALEDNQEINENQWTECRKLQRSQTEAILSLQRKLDDIDNQGRLNNLRIRGVPETRQDELEEPTNIRIHIFNQILGRSPDSKIKLDRAHRIGRPRNPPQENPRDLICCIHDFLLKEKIVQKARLMKEIKFDEHSIAVFQDLSPSTLMARKALRPITLLLGQKQIKYQWNYPFALMVFQCTNGFSTLQNTYDKDTSRYTRFLTSSGAPSY
ncbi:Hypothetical predicted protein [Pelobates cultripes]|uniref:Uncharacterized protein n=1 Tax=Pelobates cultripes TaxID=61616 RepID=A0AAD1TK31_PELCU|nr:Hypothetical predicted protein [Pelobates cultripes]